MIKDSIDRFKEMDELFANIFSGTDRRITTDPLQGNGYRILIHDDDNDDGLEWMAPARLTDFKPTADIQYIGDEVKVVADLPGIIADSLRLGVRKGMLVIDAGDADCHFHTSVTLPPVDTKSMQYSIKNGVLEVTFQIKQD